MARSALYALDALERLGADSLIFISGEADERAEDGRQNGLDDASANAGARAPQAASGLATAEIAPDGTPAEPDHPDGPPANPGPSSLIGMGGITLLDAVMAAKPDHAGGGGGGGGGKKGGNDDSNLLSKYVSGSDGVPDSDEFNVEIVFKGTWTEALQGAFVGAADYLSTIITGDIADVFFRGKVIDDVRIDAKLTAIDGEGSILGQAGPTAYRTADFLPATAIMEFDIDDAALFDAVGMFDDIVLHEMLHSIGFGTMWDLMGLVTDFSGDLRFIGDNAMSVYLDDAAFADERLADSNESAGVPVETDGGPGTAGGHWDDLLFRNEVMTGYIGDPNDPKDGTYAENIANISPNYLSMVTIAALEDMGYETIYEAGGLDTTAEVPAFPDPDNLFIG